MSKYPPRLVWSCYLAAALWIGPIVGTTSYVWAQGPSPETGNTIFPGGASLSYSADFVSRKAFAPAATGSIPATIRPTFAVSQPLIFDWGLRRDLELTTMLPIVTNHLDLMVPGPQSRRGSTGLGDALVLLKYRFLRLDSERGTTQASLMFGPKLPTGRTDARDSAGVLLPVGLQPGSGATDFFFSLSGTYTGLFHIKKLVADESASYVLRRQGTQQTRLGDSLNSRFWLSYRPYQAHSVGKEWWIGPSLTWQNIAADQIAGHRQLNSGGNMLALGVTTYFSPYPGAYLWLGLEFPVAQATNGVQAEVRRRITVGISKQFRLRR
jgi:hypothetical protein